MIQVQRRERHVQLMHDKVDCPLAFPSCGRRPVRKPASDQRVADSAEVTRRVESVDEVMLEDKSVGMVVRVDRELRGAD